MNRHFIRFVAAVLVPALLVDPAFVQATAGGPARAAVLRAPSLQARFAQEALASVDVTPLKAYVAHPKIWFDRTLAKPLRWSWKKYRSIPLILKLPVFLSAPLSAAQFYIHKTTEVLADGTTQIVQHLTAKVDMGDALSKLPQEMMKHPDLVQTFGHAPDWHQIASENADSIVKTIQQHHQHYTDAPWNHIWGGQHLDIAVKHVQSLTPSAAGHWTPDPYHVIKHVPDSWWMHPLRWLQTPEAMWVGVGVLVVVGLAALIYFGIKIHRQRQATPGRQADAPKPGEPHRQWSLRKLDAPQDPAESILDGLVAESEQAREKGYSGNQLRDNLAEGLRRIRQLKVPGGPWEAVRRWAENTHEWLSHEVGVEATDEPVSEPPEALRGRLEGVRDRLNETLELLAALKSKPRLPDAAAALEAVFQKLQSLREQINRRIQMIPPAADKGPVQPRIQWRVVGAVALMAVVAAIMVAVIIHDFRLITSFPAVSSQPHPSPHFQLAYVMIPGFLLGGGAITYGVVKNKEKIKQGLVNLWGKRTRLTELPADTSGHFGKAPVGPTINQATPDHSATGEPEQTTNVVRPVEDPIAYPTEPSAELSSEPPVPIPSNQIAPAARTGWTPPRIEGDHTALVQISNAQVHANEPTQEPEPVAVVHPQSVAELPPIQGENPVAPEEQKLPDQIAPQVEQQPSSSAVATAPGIDELIQLSILALAEALRGLLVRTVLPADYSGQNGNGDTGHLLPVPFGGSVPGRFYDPYAIKRVGRPVTPAGLLTSQRLSQPAVARFSVLSPADIARLEASRTASPVALLAPGPSQQPTFGLSLLFVLLDWMTPQIAGLLEAPSVTQPVAGLPTLVRVTLGKLPSGKPLLQLGNDQGGGALTLFRGNDGAITGGLMCIVVIRKAARSAVALFGPIPQSQPLLYWIIDYSHGIPAPPAIRGLLAAPASQPQEEGVATFTGGTAVQPDFVSGTHPSPVSWTEQTKPEEAKPLVKLPDGREFQEFNELFAPSLEGSQPEPSQLARTNFESAQRWCVLVLVELNTLVNKALLPVSGSRQRQKRLEARLQYLEAVRGALTQFSSLFERFGMGFLAYRMTITDLIGEIDAGMKAITQEIEDLKANPAQEETDVTSVSEEVNKIVEEAIQAALGLTSEESGTVTSGRALFGSGNVAGYLPPVPDRSFVILSDGNTQDETPVAQGESNTLNLLSAPGLGGALVPHETQVPVQIESTVSGTQDTSGTHITGTTRADVHVKLSATRKSRLAITAARAPLLLTGSQPKSTPGYRLTFSPSRDLARAAARATALAPVQTQAVALVSGQPVHPSFGLSLFEMAKLLAPRIAGLLCAAPVAIPLEDLPVFLLWSLERSSSTKSPLRLGNGQGTNGALTVLGQDHSGPTSGFICFVVPLGATRAAVALVGPIPQSQPLLYWIIDYSHGIPAPPAIRGLLAAPASQPQEEGVATFTGGTAVQPDFVSGTHPSPVSWTEQTKPEEAKPLVKLPEGSEFERFNELVNLSSEHSDTEITQVARNNFELAKDWCTLILMELHGLVNNALSPVTGSGQRQRRLEVRLKYMDDIREALTQFRTLFELFGMGFLSYRMALMDLISELDAGIKTITEELALKANPPQEETDASSVSEEVKKIVEEAVHAALDLKPDESGAVTSGRALFGSGNVAGYLPPVPDRSFVILSDGKTPTTETLTPGEGHTANLLPPSGAGGEVTPYAPAPLIISESSSRPDLHKAAGVSGKTSDSASEIRTRPTGKEIGPALQERGAPRNRRQLKLNNGHSLTRVSAAPEQEVFQRPSRWQLDREDSKLIDKPEPRGLGRKELNQRTRGQIKTEQARRVRSAPYRKDRTRTQKPNSDRLEQTGIGPAGPQQPNAPLPPVPSGGVITNPQKISPIAAPSADVSPVDAGASAVEKTPTPPSPATADGAEDAPETPAAFEPMASMEKLSPLEVPENHVEESNLVFDAVRAAQESLENVSGASQITQAVDAVVEETQPEAGAHTTPIEDMSPPEPESKEDVVVYNALNDALMLAQQTGVDTPGKVDSLIQISVPLRGRSAERWAEDVVGKMDEQVNAAENCTGGGCVDEASLGAMDHQMEQLEFRFGECGIIFGGLGPSGAQARAKIPGLKERVKKQRQEIQKQRRSRRHKSDVPDVAALTEETPTEITPTQVAGEATVEAVEIALGMPPTNTPREPPPSPTPIRLALRGNVPVGVVLENVLADGTKLGSTNSPPAQETVRNFVADEVTPIAEDPARREAAGHWVQGQLNLVATDVRSSAPAPASNNDIRTLQLRQNNLQRLLQTLQILQMILQRLQSHSADEDSASESLRASSGELTQVMNVVLQELGTVEQGILNLQTTVAHPPGRSGLWSTLGIKVRRKNETATPAQSSSVSAILAPAADWDDPYADQSRSGQQTQAGAGSSRSKGEGNKNAAEEPIDLLDQHQDPSYKTMKFKLSGESPDSEEVKLAALKRSLATSSRSNGEHVAVGSVGASQPVSQGSGLMDRIMELHRQLSGSNIEDWKWFARLQRDDLRKEVDALPDSQSKTSMEFWMRRIDALLGIPSNGPANGGREFSEPQRTLLHEYDGTYTSQPNYVGGRQIPHVIDNTHSAEYQPNSRSGQVRERDGTSTALMDYPVLDRSVVREHPADLTGSSLSRGGSVREKDGTDTSNPNFLTQGAGEARSTNRPNTSEPEPAIVRFPVRAPVSRGNGHGDSSSTRIPGLQNPIPLGWLALDQAVEAAWRRITESGELLTQEQIDDYTFRLGEWTRRCGVIYIPRATRKQINRRLRDIRKRLVDIKNNAPLKPRTTGRLLLEPPVSSPALPPVSTPAKQSLPEGEKTHPITWDEYVKELGQLEMNLIALIRDAGGQSLAWCNSEYELRHEQKDIFATKDEQRAQWLDAEFIFLDGLRKKAKQARPSARPIPISGIEHQDPKVGQRIEFDESVTEYQSVDSQNAGPELPAVVRDKGQHFIHKILDAIGPILKKDPKLAQLQQEAETRFYQSWLNANLMVAQLMAKGSKQMEWEQLAGDVFEIESALPHSVKDERTYELYRHKINDVRERWEALRKTSLLKSRPKTGWNKEPQYIIDPAAGALVKLVDAALGRLRDEQDLFFTWNIFIDRLRQLDTGLPSDLIDRQMHMKDKLMQIDKLPHERQYLPVWPPNISATSDRYVQQNFQAWEYRVKEVNSLIKRLRPRAASFEENAPPAPSFSMEQWRTEVAAVAGEYEAAVERVLNGSVPIVVIDKDIGKQNTDEGKRKSNVLILADTESAEKQYDQWKDKQKQLNGLSWLYNNPEITRLITSIQYNRTILLGLARRTAVEKRRSSGGVSNERQRVSTGSVWVGLTTIFAGLMSLLLLGAERLHAAVQAAPKQLWPRDHFRVVEFEFHHLDNPMPLWEVGLLIVSIPILLFLAYQAIGWWSDYKGRRYEQKRQSPPTEDVQAVAPSGSKTATDELAHGIQQMKEATAPWFRAQAVPVRADIENLYASLRELRRFYRSHRDQISSPEIIDSQLNALADDIDYLGSRAGLPLRNRQEMLNQVSGTIPANFFLTFVGWAALLGIAFAIDVAGLVLMFSPQHLSGAALVLGASAVIVIAVRKLKPRSVRRAQPVTQETKAPITIHVAPSSPAQEDHDSDDVGYEITHHQDDEDGELPMVAKPGSLLGAHAILALIVAPVLEEFVRWFVYQGTSQHALTGAIIYAVFTLVYIGLHYLRYHREVHINYQLEGTSSWPSRWAILRKTMLAATVVSIVETILLAKNASFFAALLSHVFHILSGDPEGAQLLTMVLMHLVINLPLVVMYAYFKSSRQESRAYMPSSLASAA